MAFTYQEQLRMNAIINALVYDAGEVYDISLGREFRDLVFENCNLKPDSRFRARYTSYSSSQSMMGHAAGIGNVKIDGLENKKEFKLGFGNRVRVGKWDVFASAARGICIDERFNETRESENEIGYRLQLDHQFEPINFMEKHNKAIRFLNILIVRSRYRTLKMPSVSG